MWFVKFTSLLWVKIAVNNYLNYSESHKCRRLFLLCMKIAVMERMYDETFAYLLDKIPMLHVWKKGKKQQLVLNVS